MSPVTVLKRFEWRLMALFILVAAIVHIVVTFMAVNDQRGTAYARLSRVLPVNTMTIAPLTTPATQLLPFLSSDARFAFCPFDTSSAPMRVKALLPDLGWTIGVYAPDGTSVYFAAASADRETTIDMSIIPSDNRFLGLTPQAAGKASSDAQLTVAAPRGVIVVRGPDRGAPYQAQTEAVLGKASCASGKA